MKKAGKLLIWVVAAAFLLSIGKDVIAKVVTESAVGAVTGLKLRMTSLHLGIHDTRIGIKGLRLHNPAGFEDPLMVDMPEIYVDYHLGDILKGNIHLEEVRIDLKEFVVVKNAAGALNLDSLKTVQQQKAEVEKPAEKKKASKVKLQIDTLYLNIGKVVYKDYSGGGEPKVQEFHVDINERYENITNPNSLVSVILVRTLANTTIAKLTGFDVGPLKDVASGALQSGQKIAADTAAMARDAMKDVDSQLKGSLDASKKVTSETGEKVQEAVSGTASALKDKASDLKEKIKLPLFGKE